jgi:hypothetical protein
MASLGKLLIVGGIVLGLTGVALLFADRLPFLGRLPGDLVIRREHWSLYLPLTTCILISLLLTLLFFLFGRR